MTSKAKAVCSLLLLLLLPFVTSLTLIGRMPLVMPLLALLSLLSLKVKSSSWKSKSSSRESKTSSWKAESSPRETEPSSWEAMSSLIKLRLIGSIPSCLIVYSLFLRVFKQLVSVDNLLKFLFSSWVNFVSIRMIFSRSPLEGSPDLLIVGVLFNAQDLVRVGNFLGEAGIYHYREQNQYQEETQFAHFDV